MLGSDFFGQPMTEKTIFSTERERISLAIFPCAQLDNWKKLCVEDISMAAEIAVGRIGRGKKMKDVPDNDAETLSEIRHRCVAARNCCRINLEQTENGQNNNV